MTGRGAGPGGRRLVTTDERPQQRGHHQPDRCCAPPVAAVEAHDLHPSGPVSEDRSLIHGHVLNLCSSYARRSHPKIPVTRNRISPTTKRADMPNNPVVIATRRAAGA